MYALSTGIAIFLVFSRDMPTMDVTFSNRDGLGTRKHALVTHHIVLHDSLLRAIYCGLVVVVVVVFFMRFREFLDASFRFPDAFSRLFSSPTVTMASSWV